MTAEIVQNEVTRRYNRAFLDLAAQDGKLDVIAGDIEKLITLLAQSDAVNDVISNPLIPRGKQKNVMTALAEKLDVSDVTKKFLGVICVNGRAAQLPDILRSSKQSIAARRGEITVYVTAAEKLSAAQEKALLKKLETSSSAKILLDVTVDPEILGGLIIRIGSRMIDNSVRSKLKSLHRAMKQQNTEQDISEIREVA